MTSRRSRRFVVPDSTINALETLREKATRQLDSTKDASLSIETQKKSIQREIDELNKYIKFLRPPIETTGFAALPDDVMQLIGDRAGPRAFVNMRATSHSMRNSLPISKKKQEEIYKAESKYISDAVTTKLGLPLENIVNERRNINKANQTRRTLNAKNAASLKKTESEVRMGVQQRLQPMISAQRASHVIREASPRFLEYLSKATPSPPKPRRLIKSAQKG